MKHAILIRPLSFCPSLRSATLYVISVLGLSGVGCSDVASPAVDPTLVDLDFTFEVVRYTDPSGITVDGGIGSLGVRGSFYTGSAGFALRGQFERRGKAYELSVIAEEVSGGIDVPIHYRYEAILRKLPSGQYALLVTHRSPDESTPDFVAFDGRVDVK